VKKILIIFLLTFNSLSAEEVTPLNFTDINRLLMDDNLTYKLLEDCVALNSAVTELIKDEHPKLANEFYDSANYLYPFGILTLKKIKKLKKKDAEKEFYIRVVKRTDDYMKFMRENGKKNKSYFKGTFLGTDLNYCNEIRAAIKVSVSESKQN